MLSCAILLGYVEVNIPSSGPQPRGCGVSVIQYIVEGCRLALLPTNWKEVRLATRSYEMSIPVAETGFDVKLERIEDEDFKV